MHLSVFALLLLVLYLESACSRKKRKCSGRKCDYRTKPKRTTKKPEIAADFLLQSLDITQSDAVKILQDGTLAKDIILDLINRELKKRIENGQIDIDIQEEDFILDAAYPSRKIAGDCAWWIDAIDPKAKGVIKKSSKMEGNLTSPDSTHHQAFGAALIDAELHVDVGIRANLGVRFWGCHRYARKTWPILSKTSGKVKIQASVEAKDLSITKNGNKDIDVSFHVMYGLTGYTKEWEINQFDVSKCSVSILGIKILSYCTAISNLMQQEARKYINRFQEFDAPKIFKKLEDKLNAKKDNLVKIRLNY